MVLTLNYGDLQNIKTQMKEDKIKSDKNIYCYIEAYKDTLNYMYANKLTQNLTKDDLESDLQDLAKSLLEKTTKTYKELEKKYKYDVMSNYYFKPNGIKLKL